MVEAAVGGTTGALEYSHARNADFRWFVPLPLPTSCYRRRRPVQPSVLHQPQAPHLPIVSQVIRTKQRLLLRLAVTWLALRNQNVQGSSFWQGAGELS